MELFAHFLEQVQSMGAAGEVLFVTTVMVTEMIPLFPTQPLSLASGLLFGTQKGALLMLLGVTLAATNAFLISRGVGRPLAEKVINAEMSHSKDGSSGKGWAKVQKAINEGGFWKQMAAVMVVRFTPVLPFSASNYLLGLTPLQFPAFLLGTLLGMSVWSTVYAGLGGASRRLLDGGADMGELLTDLAGKAAEVSSSPLGLTAGAAGLALTAYGIWAFTQQPEGSDAESPDAGGNGPATDEAAPAKQQSKQQREQERKQQETVGSAVGRAGSPSRRGARD